MSVNSEIVTGDDTDMPMQLSIDGISTNVPDGSDVKAALVTRDGETILIPETAQSDSATGADWPNGLIIIEFTTVQTLAILDANLGAAKIELQVILGGKRKTWFATVTIIKGNIA